VYQASGALVISQRLTSTAQVISLKGLASGMYYVQVKNGAHLTRKKVMKL
jgi:hypothetical protein